MSKYIPAKEAHEHKVKQYQSALYMLSLAFETYADNLREYMAENHLKSDLSTEFFEHKRSMFRIRKKILPFINHDSKMALFEDYEQFIIQVDKFLKYQTKNEETNYESDYVI